MVCSPFQSTIHFSLNTAASREKRVTSTLQQENHLQKFLHFQKYLSAVLSQNEACACPSAEVLRKNLGTLFIFHCITHFMFLVVSPVIFRLLCISVRTFHTIHRASCFPSMCINAIFRVGFTTASEYVIDTPKCLSKISVSLRPL